VATGTGALHC